MTVANLGLAVDSGPVAKAVGDLDRLTAASTKAEAAAKQISTGTTAAAASTRQLGAATAAAATQMTIATNAVRANNAALAITNQQSAAAQQNMRNLSFQFQDIGTMLASGQSPFTLLAQQLPQITQNGGRLTGVMGALGSTVAGLISPLGLLTTGFVLAASAAISYFSEADDEAKKAAEELEKQGDLIRSVAEEWGNALPAVKAYADERERATKLADAKNATGIVIAREFDQANEALGRFIDQMRDVLDTPFRGLKDAASELYQPMADLEQAAAALKQEIDAGGDTSDEFAALQRVVASVLDDVSQATSAQRAELVSLGQAYLDAGENAMAAAQAFNVAAASQAAADANRGRFDKTGQRVGAVNPLDDTDFNSRFGWGEVFDFPKEKKARKARAPRKTDAERSAERYDDMLRKSEQFIAAQQLEAEALGMTEEAAQALRYEQELLNQAANDNVKITPAVAAELRNYAQAMASAEAATEHLKEQMDFAKDLTRGFFEDMMSGLEQGKSVWESFGNAAMGVLDKLIDKLLNDVLDAIFEVNNAGGSSGGIIGSLIGALGLGGAGGGFSAAAYAGIGQGLYAKGGVFDQSGVTPFAKGGVVNGPTIFPFAKGVGLMGEAGPEAIMPLTRDGQGRLGVRAGGGNGNDSPVNVKFEVINQSGAKVEQQQSKGPDGETIIRAIVRDEQAKSLPKSLSSGFGITPKVTRRS